MSEDLIKRSDTIQELKECIIADHEAISEYPDDILKYNSGLLTAIQTVYDLPSVNRLQGEWIWDKDGIDWNIGAWRCSNCHGRNANLPNDEKIIPLQWSGSNFCPNCGARMKGANNEM